MYGKIFVKICNNKKKNNRKKSPNIFIDAPFKNYLKIKNLKRYEGEKR